MSSPVKLNRRSGLLVLNNLKLQIDMRKSEIKARFKIIHQTLFEREQELLKQLDDSYATISDNIILESPKASFSVEKDDKFLSLKRFRSSSKEEKGMGELEVSPPSKLKIPHFHIAWDVPLKQKFIEEYCQLTHISNEYATCNISKPFDSIGSLTACQPEGVAVSISDRKVYFADYGNNRILVANQKTNRVVGKITASELQWPQYLCVDGDFLYVSCCGDTHLVKIDRHKNKVVAAVKTNEQISGVAVDNSGCVYTCDVDGLEITVWSKELIRIRSFRLKTTHIWDDTSTWDIKIQDDTLYILFRDSPYPIQTFDLEGRLVKELVEATSLDNSYHLNLDLQGNIVVSESEKNRVKIFSNRGDQIHCIKDLQQVSGLAVVSPGEIVLCSNQRLSSL